MSEVWVWFQMPTAGLVEIWAFLQAIETSRWGRLVDHFGFSDANIEQRSSAYLEVIEPQGGHRGITLLDYRRGGDEGSWAAALLAPGAFHAAQLFSVESHAAGQWVLLAIGVEDLNYMWLDDMEADSEMTNRWFVHHVAVRSTGGP
jgi:hypothetical protein